MPAEPPTIAEPAVAEPQRDISPDTPREIGTPISEIFKTLMPFEHELEAQKEGAEGEEAPERDKVADTTPKRAVEPPQTAETAIPGVPELPKELFGEPKPKEEAPPAETEPTQAETPKEFKGKTKEHFENLSKKEFETAKRARQLEKELREVKTKVESGDPDSKARIQQLEAENAQYKQRIYAADVTLDPEFEARFTVPRNHHLEVAKKAYANAGGNPKDIEKALTATEETRAEQLSEIYGTIQNEYLKTKLQRAVDAVETIDTQIAGVMQNREGWLKQTQQQRQVEQSKYYEQRETQIKSSLEKGAKFLEEQGWEVFKETTDPNAKWWNDQRTTAMKTAEHFMLKTTDADQMAIGANMAVVAPIYRAMALQQKQRADKAEALLKEYKGSEPGLGGESEARGNGEDFGIKEDDDMKTAILKRLHRGR